MEQLPGLLITGFQVVLINLILSGDNVGVIALAVKNLPERQAKRASLLGIGAAFFLRVLFILLIGTISSVRWLHANLFGAVILLTITYKMIRDEEKPVRIKGAPTGSFLKAVSSIILADISMSLDNAIAVASIVIPDGSGLTKQRVALIVIGLLLCVPVIFWGSGAATRLMNRAPAVVYACAALLVFTAVRMLFSDDLARILFDQASRTVGMVSALLCAAAAFIFGMRRRL